MKTAITKDLLKQKCRAEKKSSLSVIAVPALFALVCFSCRDYEPAGNVQVVSN